MSEPTPALDPARREALFAEICREHTGLLARVAHAFAVERVDRDDLGQEILIALWEALPGFNARAKLSTYLYRVALSCALNWKRGQRRYQRRLDAYTHLVPELTVGSAEDQDRLRWLYARIHELPPVDRSLILLSLERVSYPDIAEITGLSESNVGVRLHRIKQHLIAAAQSYHP